MPASGQLDGARKAPIGLRMLGGFEVTSAETRLETPDSVQRLLAYLALGGCERPRLLVAATLWPNVSERRALANLRATLWRTPDTDDGCLVEATRTSVALSSQVAVDAVELEQRGWRLVRREERADDLDAGGFLQPLLPGWYEDWIDFERERVAQLHLRFLEALTYVLIERDRLVEALNVALNLVNADPLRESSQRALLSAYCADGSLGAARRQLDRYRSLLQETFSCEPEQDLWATVVSGRCQTDALSSESGALHGG